MKTTIFLLLFLFPCLLIAQENKHKGLYSANRISEKFTYEIDLENGDSLITRQEFFDESGNITRTIVYVDGTPSRTYKYEYVNGELAKKTYFASRGYVVFTFNYRYDINGNLIDQKQFDINGKLILHNHFKYNRKNLKTHFIIHFVQQNTPPYLNRKYKYDSKGRLRQIKHFNPKNSKRNTEVKYLYKHVGNEEYHYQIVKRERQLVSKIKFNNSGHKTELYYPMEVNSIDRGIFTFLDNSKLVQIKYDTNNLVLQKTTYNDQTIVKKEVFSYITSDAE